MPSSSILKSLFLCYPPHSTHVTLFTSPSSINCKSFSSHLLPCFNILMSSSSYFTRLTMPFYVTLFVSSSLTFPSLHHCPHVIVSISLHPPLLFLITSSSSHHPPHLIFLTSPSTHHPHQLTLFTSPSPVTLIMSPSNHPVSSQHLSHIFLVSARVCMYLSNVNVLTPVHSPHNTFHMSPTSCQPPHITILFSPSWCHLPHVTIPYPYHYSHVISLCQFTLLVYVTLLMSSSSHHPTPLTSPSSHHPSYSTLTTPFFLSLLTSPSLLHSQSPFLQMSPSLTYVTLPYICHPPLCMSPSLTYVTLPYICHPPLRMSPSLTYLPCLPHFKPY